jgi:hypothetical protein
MPRPLLIVAIATACGPSTSEIKTAKTTTYNADPAQILKVAVEATEAEHYKIGGVDEQNLSFATVPKFFNHEGGAETPGAEGYVQIRAGSVEVIFVVEIAGTPPMVAVKVTPKTFEAVAGSPKPRELAPDDPYLPPFVTGRADALSLAIYQRAKPYALAPPGGP